MEADISISEKRKKAYVIINSIIQNHISVNPAPSLSKHLTNDYHQEIPRIRKSCQYNTRKKNPHCIKNRLIIPREKFSIFVELLVDEIVRSNPKILIYLMVLRITVPLIIININGFISNFITRTNCYTMW